MNLHLLCSANFSGFLQPNGFNSGLSFLFINVSHILHHLTELITPYQSHHCGFHSSTDTKLLTRPKTCLYFSSKGFHASAPKLWNNLPDHFFVMLHLYFNSKVVLRLTCSNLLFCILCGLYSAVISFFFCVKSFYKCLHYY